MKDISTVLAAFFVLLSLMSLIFADPTPANPGLNGNQPQMSELGVRVALKR